MPNMGAPAICRKLLFRSGHPIEAECFIFIQRYLSLNCNAMGCKVAGFGTVIDSLQKFLLII